MDYVFSPHALDQMAKRKLSKSLVDQVLQDPQQVVPAKYGRKSYQSIIVRGGKRLILRVFIVERTRPPVVVSVYYSDTVDKYWQGERNTDEDAL